MPAAAARRRRRAGRSQRAGRREGGVRVEGDAEQRAVPAGCDGRARDGPNDAAVPRDAAVSTSALFLGLVFGSLGLGYCVYGRRQRMLVPFVSGVLLIGVPYFIANTAGLLVTGLVLAAAPFIVKI